jgi:hypothetical protein
MGRLYAFFPRIIKENAILNWKFLFFWRIDLEGEFGE